MTRRYWIAMWCGVAVAVVGSICAFLPAIGAEGALAFGRDQIAVRPATGVGFLTIGIAIVLTALSPRIGPRSFVLAASFAFLSLGVVASIALLELARGQGAVSSGVPSRGTLVAFTMAGSSLWLRIMSVRLCGWLGPPIAALGLAALAGHALDVPLLYWYSPHWTGMAVVTSALCVPMGVGIYLMPRNGFLARMLGAPNGAMA